MPSSGLNVSDIDAMSDTQLYDALKSYGVDAGPVVPTTRNVYKKMLVEKLTAQRRSLSPAQDLLNNRDRGIKDVPSSSRSSIERLLDSSDIIPGRYKETMERTSFSASFNNPQPEEVEDYGEESETLIRAETLKAPSLSGYDRRQTASSYLSYRDDLQTRPLAGSSRPSLIGDSYRSTIGSSASFGSASARADKILEDIRRRSALSSDGTAYRSSVGGDHVGRSRDILEQARASGRLNTSRSSVKSSFMQILIKVIAAIVLFAVMYLVVTLVFAPANPFKQLDEDVNKFLANSEKVEGE